MCGKEIPMGAGIMGPPKIKENNQKKLLNVIFTLTVQGGQCVKHTLCVTAGSSHCMKITDNIFKNYKTK